MQEARMNVQLTTVDIGSTLPLWRASAIAGDGRSFHAVSPSFASVALARAMVAAGVEDDALMVTQRHGNERLMLKISSFHALANAHGDRRVVGILSGGRRS
jgi:hypothetical protein